MGKVVFLDIDGVLRRKRGPQAIEPERAKLVHDFAQNRGINLVISSTWRLAYELSFFQRTISPKVVGKLPGDAKACELDERDRGRLIRIVAEKKLTGHTWATLDDDPSLFPSKRDSDRCVFVNSDYLVTEADLNKLDNLL